MSSNKTNLILAVATVFLLLIVPFLQLNSVFIIISIILFYATIIIFLKPQLGIFLLLLIRPSLDIFTTDQIISLGNFSLNFSSVLAIITLVFTFYIIIVNRARIKNLPLLLPLALFIIITLISGIFSYNKLISLAEWLRLLSIFSFYFLAYLFIKNKDDLNKLIKVIIISALLPCLLAIYQFITGTGMSLPFEGIYNRIFGTFTHPNLFAYYLIIPLALLLYLFLTKNKNKIENLLLIAPLGGLIVILVLTFTRGAWLAFIVFIFIIGAIKYRKLLLATLLILILSYFAVTPIKNRVNNLIANPYSSVTWRLSLWSDSFGYVKEKPLLGQGTGTANEFILNKRGPQFGSSDPHNDYLKIALENGLAGLLSYLFIILALLYSLIRKYFFASEPNFKIFILFIISLSVVFYIMSFADNILRNTALMWAFWSLIGAGLAVTKKELN